jgi:16S rRNA (cytidine1402-2'-O)-methyltransferase
MKSFSGEILLQARGFLESKEPRGEFVLVIDGAPKEAKAVPSGDPLEKVRMLMAQGVQKKEALAAVSKEYDTPKRELYNRLILEEEGKEK